MKILIASDTYYPSVNGAAYFTYRLAGTLAQRGHDVSVIAPSREFKNTISGQNGVTVYGVRSIHLPVYQDLRVSPLLLCKSAIRKIITDLKPDVVHVQNHFMIGKGVALEAKKQGLPVMGTNHFMPENLLHYFHLPLFAENRLKRFGWKQCLDVFEQLDKVSTPTHRAAKLLKEAGYSKEVAVISCGLDLSRFTPQNSGTHLKKIHHIPSDRPVMLYVGRLDKEKRVDTVIRALPEILEKLPVHLVLAGLGEERKALEALVKKLGVQKAVTFTGFIPDADLQNIYKVADLFVIAGIAELQSIVTMEAMASGLPVLAVDAMALPELVKDDENGYLFQDGNIHDIAQKAIAILEDPKKRAQMAEKSLEKIQKHELSTIMSRYEALYEAIKK